VWNNCSHTFSAYEEGRAFIFLLRLASPRRSSKTGDVVDTRSREEPDILVMVCCWQFGQDGEVFVILRVGILLSNTLNTRAFRIVTVMLFIEKIVSLILTSVTFSYIEVCSVNAESSLLPGNVDFSKFWPF